MSAPPDWDPSTTTVEGDFNGPHGPTPVDAAATADPATEELVAMVSELQGELGYYCKCTGARPAWRCHACRLRDRARALLAKVRP